MHIVVGVDEYPESADTLKAAIELGAALSAEVHVVHAVPFARPALLEVENLSAVRSVALDEVRGELAKRLKAMCAGTSWEGRELGERLSVVAGQPAKVLAAQARELGADLLMIGPHRKHGLMDFGNTMRQTFASAHTSIWVQIGAWRAPEKILAPIDLSAVSQVVLAGARDLARVFGASVEVVYCFPEPLFGYPEAWPEPAAMPVYVLDDLRDKSRATLEKLVAEFDWRGVPAQATFVESEPVDYLHDAGARADLLVLGQHGEGWISATVLGSTAYAILKHAPSPVLAIRHHGD